MKYVIGIGYTAEPVYWISRLASPPAAAKDWLFWPPLMETTEKEEPRALGT